MRPESLDEETWRLLCLARYVATHRDPKWFADRLSRRHGAGLVKTLRELLQEYGR